MLIYYFFFQCNVPEVCQELADLAKAAAEAAGGLSHWARVVLGFVGSVAFLAMGVGACKLYLVLKKRYSIAPTPTQRPLPHQEQLPYQEQLPPWRQLPHGR